MQLTGIIMCRPLSLYVYKKCLCNPYASFQNLLNLLSQLLHFPVTMCTTHSSCYADEYYEMCLDMYSKPAFPGVKEH